MFNTIYRPPRRRIGTFSVLMATIFISACGQLTSMSTQSNPGDAHTGLHELELSLANVNDEKGAQNAISSIESYVNRRANTAFSAARFSGSTLDDSHSVVSLSSDRKQLLAKLYVRGGYLKSSNRTQSADDALSPEDYQAQRQAALSQGFTTKDIADALNKAIANSPLTIASSLSKIAEAATPFTEHDVELLQDHVESLVPEAGDPGSSRVSPIEALLIGYAAASDDDGTQPNGEVRFYGTQDQINQFVDTLAQKATDQ